MAEEASVLIGDDTRAKAGDLVWVWVDEGPDSERCGPVQMACDGVVQTDMPNAYGMVFIRGFYTSASNFYSTATACVMNAVARLVATESEAARTMALVRRRLDWIASHKPAPGIEEGKANG